MAFLFPMCEQTSEDKINPAALKYIDLTPGGCNLKIPDGLKNLEEEKPDTAISGILQDSLNIFVGLNYICCAPFTTEAEILKDSLIITIIDTCSTDLCYCRCTCYYTWDFKFSDFEGNNYYLLIRLKDPREAEPIIIEKGRISYIE